MPQNPMTLTLTEYNTGRANFQNHYFLANCDTNIGGQEITLPWADLQSVVDSYMLSTQQPAEKVALRFVHCFDADNSELYVRLQLCTLVQQSGNEYSLDTSASEWYVIKNGQISQTQDKDLFDASYLEHFYYCNAANCSPNTCEQLASDTAEEKYVRNLVLPWGMEILEMYNANQNATEICLGAAAFTDNPGAGVLYPHCIGVCLMENSSLLLDDNQYNNNFEMKGCDTSTLCPNYCNTYVSPL